MERLQCGTDILLLLVYARTALPDDGPIFTLDKDGVYWRIYANIDNNGFQEKSWYNARKFCRQLSLYDELGAVSTDELNLLQEKLNEQASEPLYLGFYRENNVWLGTRRRAGTTEFVNEDGTGRPKYLPWAPGRPRKPGEYHPSRDYCVRLNLKKAAWTSSVRIWAFDSECYEHFGIVCKKDIFDDCASSPCREDEECIDYAGGYRCEEAPIDETTTTTTTTSTTTTTTEGPNTGIVTSESQRTETAVTAANSHSVQLLQILAVLDVLFLVASFAVLIYKKRNADEDDVGDADADDEVDDT